MQPMRKVGKCCARLEESETVPLDLYWDPNSVCSRSGGMEIPLRTWAKSEFARTSSGADEKLSFRPVT